MSSATTVNGRPTSPELRFDGRTAIVTGAARGLGRSFALLLAARGANVVLNDLSGTEPVIEEIRAAGGKSTAVHGNIADEETAEALVAHALDVHGGLDILINNAGLLVLKSFADTTPQELMRTLEVNVRGAWLLTHAAWAHFAAQGYGRVVMVASMNGVGFATDKHTAYGASKGALAGLTRELAFEGAQLGIVVNALLPGAVTTMLNTVTAPSGSAYRSPDIDMRPSLVAPVAAWLAHEACKDTGLLINSSSARAARLFTSLSEGHQSSPDAFTLEGLGQNWDAVLSGRISTEIRTVDDYNVYRTRRYRDVVD